MEKKPFDLGFLIGLLILLIEILVLITFPSTRTLLTPSMINPPYYKGLTFSKIGSLQLNQMLA
jgi:prepilin signal peptidase PulO-like enzyme (type II secretory pathway)